MRAANLRYKDYDYGIGKSNQGIVKTHQQINNKRQQSMQHNTSQESIKKSSFQNYQ